MDSAGIWSHSHGCPNNIQPKCSKLKKPPVPSSVIPKKLCGFVFRRNNDNRVYRSESFRFIHKNDVFLPIGRASARSLGIPVSENYMDPVDHKEGRPDEPAYNEIAEKYNAPYYYSDTIKESSSAKEPEPPYCSPCPPATTDTRFYANEKIRLSCKRKDDENLRILNSDTRAAATHKWSTCMTTTDQTIESCSSPPQSPLDNAVDKLLEPVRTINLEDKPILPIRRSPFVSICRIENSPNGTLTNFSVVSNGDLHSHQHQQHHQQQQQHCHSSDSHNHLKNSSDFPHLKCMKAPSSETFDKELPRVAKTNGYYRSFRAPAYSFQISKNDSCGQCGCKIENVLTVPIISENCCDGRSDNNGNGRPLLRDALLDPNGQYSQSKVPENQESSLCIINNNNLDGNDVTTGICEGNTEIISCCPYHPLRVYSTYGGIKTEEILWPCNTTSVPGYQPSHFYSQVNIGTPVTTSSSPSPTALIKNYGCSNSSHDRTSDKLCSKTAKNNSKSQYSSATSSSTGSSSSGRTSTSSTSARIIPKDVQEVDFVNSDNNYLKSPPYLNSSSECQIRQYPFKIDVPLENQDWFHGAITRVESERILQAACEGSFLVRNCENSPRNHYSLSIRSSKGYIHIRIEPNNVGTYTLGEQEFPSVPYLIQHFMLSKLPIKGEEHVKLMHPVITQFL